MKKIITPFAAFISTICCFAQAADWPTGRFDYHRNAKTPEALPANLSVAWKWKSQWRPRQSWYGPARWDAYAKIRDLRSMRNYDLAFNPIIAGGNAYWGSSSDDSVYCVSLTTGKVKWRHTTGGAVRLAPTYADGKLYFGSDDGYAYALDARTGSLLWKYSPTEGTDWILNDGHYISRWPCRVGLVVENGIVYAAFSLMPWKASYLCALNARTGRPEGKNAYRVTHRSLTFESLPVLTKDSLIYPQGRLAPYVFDRATGREKGAVNKTRGYGGCFITFDAGKICYGPGNVKWGAVEFALKGKNKMKLKFPKANKIIFDGDTAFALTNDSIYAVSKNDPKKRIWKTALEAPLTFIIAGKTIYAGVDGAVSALDPTNGKVLWSIPLEGRVWSMAAGDACGQWPPATRVCWHPPTRGLSIACGKESR